MSYDLFVLTQKQPTEQQLLAFLAEYPAATVEGVFAEPNNVVVDARGTEDWIFTVDPPTRFTWDDAPFDPEDEEMQQRLRPMPEWETFIAVPYGAVDTGLEVAHALARRLADQNEGMVWDPQSEELS